ncbi:transposase [Blastopirellula marina]|uniref:ISRm2011-2 transposase protein n=1 Tax=Blastopirellula marina DSM 3645 TaxID=314230 RepID=A4A253_9BACT|nr:transposase [Blastopirellula marina]EAQ77156.1 ISRm2011-2 transposase protein [Blastopirellula marina DSM 3645]
MEKRAQWKRDQSQIDPQRADFIDETWAKTNMTRTYGRSEQGTRLIEHVPAGRWETTTFLGTLRADGFRAPLNVDGPINGSISLAWIKQHLAPTLSAGDVFILDNLSSHKVRGVREAIEKTGAELRFLSPVFAGPEPNRTGLLKAQKTAACWSRTNGRQALGSVRPRPRQLHSK